jgi:hypothetical protein
MIITVTYKIDDMIVYSVTGQDRPKPFRGSIQNQENWKPLLEKLIKTILEKENIEIHWVEMELR